MGTFYYVILILIIASFLACIVFTVFDNNKDIPKVEKKNTNFKSRRTLYSDYVDRVSTNNYYSYNYYKKEEPQIIEEEVEELEQLGNTVEQPVITSVVEVEDGFLNNTQSIIPVLDI